MYKDTIKCVLKLSFITFLSILAISGCNREANLISASKAPEVVENEMEKNQNVSETEYSSDLETDVVNSQNTLEVEARQDYVKVKVHNQRDYEVFIEQLEKYNHYHSLYMDLCGIDTVIYLDELLTYQNIRFLQIENSGIIDTKDALSLETSNLSCIELYHISALQENLLNQFNGIREIRIRLDNRYTGKLPIMELLNNMDCENIVLIWDDNDEAEGIGQLNGEDTYNGNNREWEYFYAALPKENQYLKGLYRVNEEDYSYTSYEFYGTDSKEACAAFVCIKDS